MKLTIRPATPEMFAELRTWRYEPPYDFYDGDAEPVRNPERWYEARDEAGALVGNFYFEEKGDALEIGLGLRPDLTGRGLGLDFLLAGIDFGRLALRPSPRDPQRRRVQRAGDQGLRAGGVSRDRPSHAAIRPVGRRRVRRDGGVDRARVGFGGHAVRVQAAGSRRGPDRGRDRTLARRSGTGDRRGRPARRGADRQDDCGDPVARGWKGRVHPGRGRKGRPCRNRARRHRRGRCHALCGGRAAARTTGAAAAGDARHDQGACNAARTQGRAGAGRRPCRARRDRSAGAHHGRGRAQRGHVPGSDPRTWLGGTAGAASRRPAADRRAHELARTAKSRRSPGSRSATSGPST